jgi:clostripain
MSKYAILTLVTLAGGVLALAVARPAAAARDGVAKATEPQRPWTVLVYAAADNSADMPVVEFLDQVRKAIDDDPGVELLVLLDRSNQKGKKATYLGPDFSGTRLYRYRKDSVERLGGGTHLPELKADGDAKLNSADADTLGRFIAWGKATAPAKRYALLIYSHANGKTMCPAEAAKADMGIPELTAKIGPEGRVDFLALELCQMGGIEIAYQWRPENGRFGADVLLAIPNAGPPLDWDRAFARIRSPGHAPKGGAALDPATMTAADFGRLVVEEGLCGRQAAEKAGRKMPRESAGCYDLRAAAEVKKAVDALAVTLTQGACRDIVLALRDGASGSGAGSTGPAIHYERDKSYVDLYDLCRRIAACDRLPESARAAARRVLAAGERFMLASFGMSGYPGFEPGKHGVFIVLPSGKPDCWKQFKWYSPVAGKAKHQGGWSFLADGATRGNGVVENWFELLDSWFDQQNEQGGLNGYRP